MYFVHGTNGELTTPTHARSLTSPYLKAILLFRFVFTHCVPRPQRTGVALQAANNSRPRRGFRECTYMWGTTWMVLFAAEPLFADAARFWRATTRRINKAEVSGIATSVSVIVEIMKTVFVVQQGVENET